MNFISSIVSDRQKEPCVAELISQQNKALLFLITITVMKKPWVLFQGFFAIPNPNFFKKCFSDLGTLLFQVLRPPKV